ncbi:CPBP family intramembrane glutamic endopeptidase [Planctomicrobium piriforme]|uniref:CAAX prenyl protease 2/Lysostaphin resistance protein A-like domain-containing protein n=1 Tax=Planctomicrobium piriforme TaxID=1576369 RepID=A0A1I3HGP7_9PLAN|nr:CPBP family intramembrane glutamic endopeptidase [Planctomicrobium piriforme]SFI34823.1 hypothetical protein SAMN05421753_10853 [Planctomicrobium piriforme]
MNLDSRRDFLLSSALFLAGLVVLSLILAAWAQIHPFHRIHFTLRDAAIACVAAVIMLAVFSNFSNVRDQAEDILGPALARCTWLDLLVLALCVGFSEELLFRGVLEPWAARLHPVGALIAVNLLFGALHAVSLSYAVIAAVLGSILSLLAYGPGGDNLFRPMLAHGIYDFLGFVWTVRDVRKKRILPPSPVGPELPSEHAV